MPALLSSPAACAIAAAATWGGGDFAGGMGVKHAGTSLRSALKVVLLCHGASLAGLLLIAAGQHDLFPAGTLVLWGLTAGLFGGLAVVCFYICLASGAMGPSAALSGLLAAAIPSAVAVRLDGAPSAVQLAGFLLAAGAIWLIAAAPSRHRSAPGVLRLSLVSGAGFGCYFVALRMAGAGGTIWPLALSRCASLLVCLAGLAWVAMRPPLKPGKAPHSLTRMAVAWALAATLLDTSGNLLFLAAARAGRLDVASVLASLYPASTILLAAWLLCERPTTRQIIGMGIAAAAVALITR